MFRLRCRSLEVAIAVGGRLVERCKKVHGEVKAGGDPAGTDAGNRPLTLMWLPPA
ncbi:MAG: hypothetical protein GX244_02345 [Firmicutes bacterium]|nr:hypothetical protein [Bacillota bacterium]